MNATEVPVQLPGQCHSQVQLGKERRDTSDRHETRPDWEAAARDGHPSRGDGHPSPGDWHESPGDLPQSRADGHGSRRDAYPFFGDSGSNAQNWPKTGPSSHDRAESRGDSARSHGETLFVDSFQLLIDHFDRWKP